MAGGLQMKTSILANSDFFNHVKLCVLLNCIVSFQMSTDKAKVLHCFAEGLEDDLD